MNKYGTVLVGAILCFSFIEGSWGDISGTGSEQRAISFGFLSFLMTDAPVDEAGAVVVQIKRLELVGKTASFTHEFDPPQLIDVLALQGGVTHALLNEVPVPSGKYDELRLELGAAESGCRNLVTPFLSYVESAGVKYPLVITRGSQQVLSFPLSMSVADGRLAEYVMDFDLRRGLNRIENGDCYRLQPTARIQNLANVGHVQGTVDSALLFASHCEANAFEGKGAAIYAYRGANVTPSDMSKRHPGPWATAALTVKSAELLSYKLAFLSPGRYTIALSCQAGRDRPDQQDNLSFEAVQNVTIRVGESTLADF